jgi:diguanylate cyclase (GGDEF)-like protein
MRNRLGELIGTDPLTGCLNRRALEARLRADWRQAKRRGSHVAILAIDLDHFKEINDTRGHPVGDQVLQQLAGIMKGTARDTDAVSRFGGDEFVLLLPDTGWQGALTFAERLRRRVDDFAFGPPASSLAITVSIGVALARGTDPISPEVLLQEADRALYKAKTGGRNRVFA